MAYLDLLLSRRRDLLVGSSSSSSSDGTYSSSDCSDCLQNVLIPSFFEGHSKTFAESRSHNGLRYVRITRYSIIFMTLKKHKEMCAESKNGTDSLASYSSVSDSVMLSTSRSVSFL